MKKQANILEYVEKYKYKYGISYADEKSNLVKKLHKFIKLFTIFMIGFILIFNLSLLFSAQGENFSFLAINNSAYATDFYVLLGCFLILFATLLLAKFNKLFLAIEIVVLPISVECFKAATESNLTYMTTFYVGAIPAYFAVLLIAALVFILIRAKVKTNRIYDMLVEGLYKQYGSKDGEKLSEEEWQEFLKQYNPKKMFADDQKDDKDSNDKKDKKVKKDKNK
ncbi:MAG: hypothetical protein IKT42_05415 [Clostridia bacterium]|nr:hypothetical protein [Clostridia bacterium]